MATEAVPPLTVGEILASVRGRDLGCEGIPMFLALHGAVRAPAGDPRRLRGVALAERLIAVHAEVERATNHPRTRAERRAALAAAETVTEGVARTAQSGRGPAELARVDAEAARAVSEPERMLAEAIAVVAHIAFAEPPIELVVDGSIGEEPAAGTPLGRMVAALREGRYLAVVNYHNTPASAAPSTRDELARWGAGHCGVRPADLDRLFAEGTWPHPRPPLIPVLYEGYRNNVEVAAPACADAGLVGWFFLIAGFLDAAPESQAAFAEAHEIALAQEELDAGRAPLAMGWEQAGELAASHVVTTHTAHHAAAHSVRDEATSVREIDEPASTLRRATGVPAVAHAWLFGSELASDPRHAEALCRAGYRWVFSNTAIEDVASAAAAARTRA